MGIIFTIGKNAYSCLVYPWIVLNTCVAAIGAMRFSCVASAAHFLFCEVRMSASRAAQQLYRHYKGHYPHNPCIIDLKSDRLSVNNVSTSLMTQRDVRRDIERTVIENEQLSVCSVLTKDRIMDAVELFYMISCAISGRVILDIDNTSHRACVTAFLPFLSLGDRSKALYTNVLKHADSVCIYPVGTIKRKIMLRLYFDLNN